MMHDPDQGDLSGASSPEPIGLYTETLARLYLGQGFVSKGLEIYRHLAAAQPANRSLSEQIAALERQLAAEALSEAGAPTGASPAEAAAQASRDRLEHTQQVIGQLERWLAQVRRQQRA